jgi:hypothetical protein
LKATSDPDTMYYYKSLKETGSWQVQESYGTRGKGTVWQC